MTAAGLPNQSHSLAEIFLRSARDHRGRAALWVDGTHYTYGELLGHALQLSRKLDGDAPCGVLAQRSLAAYAGVLAAVLRGVAFVPLNPKFPKARNERIARMAGLKAIVTDDRTAAAARAIQADWDGRLDLLALEPGSAEAQEFPAPPSRRIQDTAYIMFTSGTTGVPKGVCVTEGNVSDYVNTVIAMLKPGPEDRFSQLFDFSFDLSVHDLFVTWASGGCLYVLPASESLAPVAFVRAHRLTYWFSVPSSAAFANRFNQLVPGAMPSLTTSLFCGEALPQALAQTWQAAAPNSRVFNFYGPTEATIAITAHRFEGALPDVTSVPIGHAFPGQETAVVTAGGALAAPGESGELLLGGSQIAAGYLDNEAANAERFVLREFPGKTSTRWYRTGDIVHEMPQVGLIFRGRGDDQVKVGGYRVELLEIETVLRDAAETALVAALPWPLNADGAAEGIVAFVSGSARAGADIIRACAKSLPVYMVPRKIFPLDEMPVTASGKIDRQKLRAFCEQQGATPRAQNAER